MAALRRLVVELGLSTVLLGCLEGTHPAPISAAQLLVDSLRSAPSDVVLIATGPLSNVAAALRLDAARPPSATTLSDHMAGTWVMGGAVHVPGNLCCTTTAGFDGTQELNIWIDPAAARDTFSSLPEHSVSLIAPGVVGYESERIVVVQEGAQSGRTAASPEGRGMQVGVSADQARFEQIFIDTLNGRS